MTEQRTRLTCGCELEDGRPELWCSEGWILWWRMKTGPAAEFDRAEAAWRAHLKEQAK